MEFIKRYFAMVIDFIATVIVLIILMFIFAIVDITDMEPNY
jgi:lipopolysaccharide/colanic/teichoic acid biosynthesis glycosyltransferase